MAFKRHHFQPDTPTNVFATLNPLYTRGTLSNGNLEHTSTSTYSTATSTFLIPSSVPIYFEVYVKSVNATNIGVMRGYGNIDQNLYIGYDPSVKLFGISYRNNGDIYGDSEGAGTAEAASSGAATDGYTTGDIVGVFVDISSNTLKFYKTNIEFKDIGTPKDFFKTSEFLLKNYPRPCAFLDRDGVINKDYGYVNKISDFKWMPYIRNIIKHLNKKKYLIIVVSNQSGVGRGYYPKKNPDRNI